MKKLFSLLLVSLFLSGSAAALTQPVTHGTLPTTVSETLTFSDTTLSLTPTSNGYLTAALAETSDLLANPGEPTLPRIQRTYELPLGTTNIQVRVDASDLQEITIEQPITPAKSPLPLGGDVSRQVTGAPFDASIYTSDTSYPGVWYSMHTGVGLGSTGARVTYLTVDLFPLQYYPASNRLILAHDLALSISYQKPSQAPVRTGDPFSLVVITPKKFQAEAQRLVDHKNSFGMKSYVMTLEDIYSQYQGADKPEQIKYFLKDAIETHNITYALLVGGLKSSLWAHPRDTINYGAKGWYFPVRFSNFNYDGGPGYNYSSDEPGYLCDLYYADVYKYDNQSGYTFDNWDSNNNGVYAEWSGNKSFDKLDQYPDLGVGRLACSNDKELTTVIDKEIKYESTAADPSWFKHIMVCSGDGFIDQTDWGIHWNTTTVPEGAYTVCAQSINPWNKTGPIDRVNITIDRTENSTVTFNQDDNLNPALANGYPAPPIAEIVSVSPGNTLGSTDVTYTPNDGEAYCNDLYWWANVSYVGGVLTIRGKSYEPAPYHNITSIHVWVEDTSRTIIFEARHDHMENYYEGEWAVGNHTLQGRGGALTFMPSDWVANQVFTSNGLWHDQNDVIREFSKGYGLVYFDGHGSPGWWGDHYAGIPGNRRYGQVAGLVVSQIYPYFPFVKAPALPMRKLANTDKLPVVCVGGCHNSMFSVSLIPSILNFVVANNMFTYGSPTPSCWSWYLVKMPHTGAIACIGNTGFGWGSEGNMCTIGTGDSFLNTEFFHQYGTNNQHVLGMAYSQAISSYIDYHMTFEHVYWRHDFGWDGIDQKTIQEWVLLGDPSLMIGGYS